MFYALLIGQNCKPCSQWQVQQSFHPITDHYYSTWKWNRWSIIQTNTLVWQISI